MHYTLGKSTIVLVRQITKNLVFSYRSLYFFHENFETRNAFAYNWLRIYSLVRNCGE